LVDYLIMMKYKPLNLLHIKGLKHLLVFILGAFPFLLSSCKVTQPSVYFKTLQKDTTLSGFITNDFESKIIKGDKLSIAVSSINPAEDLIFNAAQGSIVPGATSGGYTVQANGTVQIHRLGSITAEGLTRKELAKKIETGLAAYSKEPIVQVNYLNHKLTIMGEVSKPQVLNMPEEQISMIDALVLSGDVTPSAKKNSITVIREEGNEKKVKHINLEDHSIFSSPWYYAKPNDIIIVAADTEKFVKEENRRKLQTNISLVASVVSLVIIILSQVFK
jgi:polysaccharide biosynthesis/export protein